MEWLDNKICDREYGGVNVKFRIYYQIGEYQDSFLLECETIAEGRGKIDDFVKARTDKIKILCSERLD